ncbi:sulfate transporter family-domain-containing protein [Rhodocollybia butyracea]|uniref:Sulfate transporter family-domain-containing protein n=1 Tax=Rhodocollybia butyracea TaxID=206335 RepID=A0A9P5U5N8_9AGAR|nr:sulfate transporter family-domain-containing protein [Rhodocollybia butyracea]
MVPSAKDFGKKVIGYPEHTVPVVTVKDWFSQFNYDPIRFVINYVTTLFPITGWISRYNLGWLTGDVIAGLTVGIVLVPQGMSYATIATLPVEYGLYSSFVGVLLYCFFATSKDVSIGPVAVMSLVVSQIIASVDKAHPGKWAAPEIATALAFITGFIALGIGLLRLGWIVEFIPGPAVSGFMTGSAINIAAGQVPGLMGITGFNTRGATYLVIIDTLKGLPLTTKDAAFGLTGLFALYAIRIGCDYLTKRFPRRARVFFFISVFRNAFVIVVLTIAAWLYTRHRGGPKGKFPIKILGTVPAGFQHVGQPVIDRELVSALAGQLPIATVILVLEHIAISKSFGRINNYKINPNQELIAIGVTNTIGSCFGAYPATGSFSRSALKHKSGVRTPAAGILSAIIVVVALYGLTSAFFWIPNAGLSAIIIHAVADLVASPRQVFSYWRVSPLEFLIWATGVLVTIFSTIEIGVYVSTAVSLVLMLVRVAHPRGYFLGKVTLRSETPGRKEKRDVFVPLAKDGIINPDVKVTPPTPGVIVYRFEESYLYPNSSIVNSVLVDYVKANMRRGKDMSAVKLRDRPWNDPGPRRGEVDNEREMNNSLPILHAIVLDFSTVSHLDTTATQALIDTRNELERWADHPVEFHFASILSPWIRRALVAGGFGVGTSSSRIPHEIAAVVPYRDGLADRQLTDLREIREEVDDIEKGNSTDSDIINSTSTEFVFPLSTDTPFFHLDLESAVRAAESGLENNDHHY